MDVSRGAITHALTVEYRNPADLKPDPGNARSHSKKQVAQIIASLRRFGFANPILVDEDGVIIAGHGRLMAVKEIGLDAVPVIVLRGLSQAEKKALRLADNRIAEGAAWNVELLAIEIAAIKELDITLDLEVTGFAVGQIDKLIHNDADPDDDEAPPLPAEPRTRLGDIWVLGEHRIGCGDCRDQAFMARLMGWSVADAAFLDPPYNVSITSHANVKARHREFAMASGEMTRTEFAGYLTDALRACTKVSKDGAVHFVCMDWRHQSELIEAGEAVYGSLLNLCIWRKSNAGMGSLYRSQHELIYVYKVGTASHFNAVELGKHGRNRTNVWDYPSVNSFNKSRQAELALHPTAKAVAMVADAIKDVTKPGEVVLDAFLGSGTSLIAAERVGRRFRGCDIDPAYVDVAVDRWVAMTGLEPRLERPPTPAVMVETVDG